MIKIIIMFTDNSLGSMPGDTNEFIWFLFNTSPELILSTGRLPSTFACLPLCSRSSAGATSLYQVHTSFRRRSCYGPVFVGVPTQHCGVCRLTPPLRSSVRTPKRTPPPALMRQADKIDRHRQASRQVKRHRDGDII